MKKEKGFTLIELLVVISIIALLLSILMPSLSKAKYQAQRIICINDIRGQTVIQQLYAADNNGKYHPHDNYSPEYSLTFGADDNLFLAISDYVENVDLMNCPILKRQSKHDSSFEMFDPEFLGFAANWKAFPTLKEMKANIGGGIKIQNIVSSYMWLANYRCNWPNVNDPTETIFNFTDAATGIKVNEEPWPKADTDATSRTAFIVHRISDVSGYFFDYSHKGAGFSPAPNGFIDFATGVDNPVGRGDGSVTTTRKSNMEPRALTNAGIIYY